MNLSPAQARAAMLQVDPARLRAGRPIGLRDGALLALVAAGFSAIEIADLRATAITMARGRAVVTVRRRGFPFSSVLPIDLGSRVLAWINERRLWAKAEPVFTGPQGALSPSAVCKVLERYCSQQQQPAPTRRSSP